MKKQKYPTTTTDQHKNPYETKLFKNELKEKMADQKTNIKKYVFSQ